MTIKKLGIVTIAALCANTAFAQDTKRFTMDAEVGLISTTGNTNTSSAKAKLDARQDLKHWRTNYIFEALYKQDEALTGDLEGTEQTTAQRWFSSAQADYKLDDKHRGLFVFASYGKDRFSGFDYQSSIALGFSDRLFQNGRSHLDYSVGPGMSFNKIEDPEVGQDDKEESAIIRLSANYLYQISETAKFTQTFASDVAVESNENTRSSSETAVSANLNSKLALKASLSLVHNTEVPRSKENLDTQTAVTVVYSF